MAIACFLRHSLDRHFGIRVSFVLRPSTFFNYLFSSLVWYVRIQGANQVSCFLEFSSRKTATDLDTHYSGDGTQAGKWNV